MTQAKKGLEGWIRICVIFVLVLTIGTILASKSEKNNLSNETYFESRVFRWVGCGGEAINVFYNRFFYNYKTTR